MNGGGLISGRGVIIGGLMNRGMLGWGGGGLIMGILRYAHEKRF